MYLRRLQESLQRTTYSRTFLKEMVAGLKTFESLNLQGIESWTEHQQQSARNLIMEYQHRFAMNLSELGRTSLIQHDIKFDDITSFKEQY